MTSCERGRFASSDKHSAITKYVPRQLQQRYYHTDGAWYAAKVSTATSPPEPITDERARNVEIIMPIQALVAALRARAAGTETTCAANITTPRS